MPNIKAERFQGALTSKADMWAARGSQTADIQQTIEAQSKSDQVAAKTKAKAFEERSKGGSKTLILVAIAAIAGYFFLRK